jgi:hypothetical protein
VPFAGPRRFEVEGADLVRSFAIDLGIQRTPSSIERE